MLGLKYSRLYNNNLIIKLSYVKAILKKANNITLLKKNLVLINVHNYLSTFRLGRFNSL